MGHKMDIAIFESEEWEASACQTLLQHHRVRCTRAPLTAFCAVAFNSADVISTFVDSRLTTDVLRSFPNLKLVATRSTGYDHIDLAYCTAAGIRVANVPSYGDVTVAEHVFALLLALTRNLLRTVSQPGAPAFARASVRGSDLAGKTMGVIGTGRIGQRVIRIARGFDMQVIGHDERPSREVEELPGVRYADVETLLRQADVVTLHVPATASTAGMIGANQLALMKGSAILINTARGSVVDVAALVEALTTGRIRGAGLDVLPQEPLMRDEAEIFRSDYGDTTGLRDMLANHVLMTLPNVIVTPHVAYNTVEAMHRILDTTVANIEAFAAGSPRNIVT